MKKILLLAFSLTAFVFAVSGAKKSIRTDFLLSNQMDSVNYAIGVMVGHDLRHQLDETMGQQQNAGLISQGLSTTLRRDPQLMSKETADSIVNTYMTKQLEKKKTEHIEKNKAFLNENKLRPGVTTTPSGLQYEILTKGTGKMPTSASTVKVNYEGRLIDGKVFDSSYSRNEPLEFRLDRVIPGWTEGLQLMPVGSKYRFFIPSELGYGGQPAGLIPPFSTLIFDVELLDVK